MSRSVRLTGTIHRTKAAGCLPSQFHSTSTLDIAGRKRTSRIEAVNLAEAQVRPAWQLTDEKGEEAHSPKKRGEDRLEEHAALEEEDAGGAEDFVCGGEGQRREKVSRR